MSHEIRRVTVANWLINNLRAKLAQDTTPLGKTRLHYFDLNKGPWSDLDGQIAFMPGVPEKKLPSANFYPEDMSKDEFETWAAKLPWV